MKLGDRVRMIDDPSWKGTIVEKWDAKGIVYLNVDFDNGQKAVQVQRGQIELIHEENCQTVPQRTNSPSNKTIAEALFAASNDLIGTAAVRPFGWALASAARVFHTAAKADAQAAQVLFDEIDLTTPPNVEKAITLKDLKIGDTFTVKVQTKPVEKPEIVSFGPNSANAIPLRDLKASRPEIKTAFLAGFMAAADDMDTAWRDYVSDLDKPEAEPDMNPQIPTNIDREPPTLYMRSVSHWQTVREVHEQGRKSPYSRYVVRVVKHHLGSYELTLLAPDPVSHGQAPFHVSKGETVFFSEAGVKAHNETATVTLPRAKLVHCISLIASGHEQKARFQLEQLLL